MSKSINDNDPYLFMTILSNMWQKKPFNKRLETYSYTHFSLLSLCYLIKQIINFLYLFLSTISIVSIAFSAQLFPIKSVRKRKKIATIFVVISLLQYYCFVIYMFQLHTIRVLRIVEKNWRLCSVTHMMYWQALVILCI